MHFRKNYLFLVLSGFVLLFPFSCKKSGKPVTITQSKTYLCYADSLGYAMQKSYMYDSSILYYNQALNYADSINSEFYYAKITQRIGDTYYYASQMDSAFEYYRKAANMFGKLGEQKLYSTNLNNLGICYAIYGNYDSSLFYMQKSLDISITTGDTANILDLHQNMGIVYGDIGNYKEAISHSISALNLAEYLKDSIAVIGISGNLYDQYINTGDSMKAFNLILKSKEFITENSNNEDIATFYYSMGEMYFNYKNNLDSAKYYYKKLLEISKQSNYKRGESAAYGCFAKISTSNGEIKKSINYLKSSIEIDIELQHPYGLLESYLQIIDNYNRLQYYDSAFHKLQVALDIAIKNNVKELLPSIYEGLYKYNKQTKNFNNALKYHELYMKEKEVINGLQVKKEILDVEAKYENEKSKRQIEHLDAENKIQHQQLKIKNAVLIASMFLLVSLVIVFVLIIRQNKLEARFQKIELEQKLLKAQLRPHFIFNVLNSLKFFIQKENTQEALKHLNSFSRLMRKTLHQTSSEEVTLQNELEMLGDYIQLESTKFNDNLVYNFIIDESVAPEKLSIPPFILQPFVENSLVHGFKEKIGADENKIDINIKKIVNQNAIQIEIMDNGTGYNPKNKSKSHESKGTELTIKRIKFFNKSNGVKLAPFTIEPIKNNTKNCTGTIVQLFLAIKEAGQ